MKLLFLTVFLGLPSLAFSAEKEWIKLYNGRDLTGWQTTGNWLPQKDGSLLIQPRPGEKGWQRYGAYLWTSKMYKDFVLQVEYKYLQIFLTEVIYHLIHNSMPHHPPNKDIFHL